MVSVLAGHGNHLSTPIKYVETPRPRSKLSHLSFSGQLSPLLGLPLLPDHTLTSSRLPPRPYKGLNSILSHSHYSLFYFGLPSYLPLAWLLISILSHSHTTLSSTLDCPPTCHWPGSWPMSLIPYWSAQSTGLLYNQRSFCARLTHHPDVGGSTHL
jgi:hypothetical protein